MKNVFDHIEHIKGKPHHIRKSVAFGIAATITAIIAIAWLTINLASGNFAIQGSSFADSVGQNSVEVVSGNGGNANVAGVAASVSDTSGPARIEIIDANSAVKKSVPIEQTTIPF